jgi:hypothetical protein
MATITGPRGAKTGHDHVHIIRRTEGHQRLELTAHDGVRLDATFYLEAAGEDLTVRYESRSGAAGSGRVRNHDYIPGLELLLERLQHLDATIDDIVVDSDQVHRLELPRDQRRLGLRDGRRYPLALAAEPEIHELRLAISAAQRPIGRRSGAVRVGGTTPSIRLYISGLSLGRRELERRLAGR